MRIFILNTGLFTKDAVLERAIAGLAPEHQIARYDATRSDLEDADWDSAVKDLVAADRVITI